MLIENLTLNDVLKNSNDFIQLLVTKSLIPSPINSTFENLILSSNPNFNYLYSNYSTAYQDPQGFNIIPKVFLNVLYGSDLESLDVNRNTNLVNDSIWIRNQMCSTNKNYLLRGSIDLINFLCNGLNDQQLTDLFIIISSEIDFTATREKVKLFIKQILV